jgi:hypothetical protein
VHYLEVAMLVEEQVLGFDVSVGDTLGVEVFDALEDLLKATLDLAGAHAATFDRGVEVPARTVLHDLAPVLVLVFDQIHGLDNVDVVEGGGDAKLGSEFLDILFLCLVLAALAELLGECERACWSKQKRRTLTA